MLNIQPLIKHDRYVEELCDKLKHNYDVLLKHVPLYSVRKRLIGEIDVLAIRDDVCDIYEVKCSHRITKARKQMSRIRRILSTGSLERRVRNSFFFCGESGALIEV